MNLNCCLLILIIITQYLVAKVGVNVITDTTKDGSTPLHIAASNYSINLYHWSMIPLAVGDLEVTKWIMNFDKSGKVIKMVDNNGSTPAHNAADSQ